MTECLTFIEKKKLEAALGMQSGYVIDFSNNTFEEFFREVVGVEIYDPIYDYRSGSKANRMRAFWSKATEKEICKFLTGLIDVWDLYSNTCISDSNKKLIESILARLGGSLKSEQSESKTAKTKIEDGLADTLRTQLLELSGLQPQRRGFAFELFLKELFDAYGLDAKASFRIMGEQIDGSFVFNNETYLLEAKWQNLPTAAADLHIFEGKLGEKASWARGLFVSYSGFTSVGLEAFGRGKRVICMDGYDLSEILNERLSFTEVLDAKIRLAAETGQPYAPVRNLILGRL